MKDRGTLLEPARDPPAGHVEGPQLSGRVAVRLQQIREPEHGLFPGPVQGEAPHEAARLGVLTAHPPQSSTPARPWGSCPGGAARRGAGQKCGLG